MLCGEIITFCSVNHVCLINALCRQNVECLGAFAKLRKATLDSSYLSVRMEPLGSHWTGFHKILYLRIFRECVQKIQISLKSDENNGYFTWRRLYIYDKISRWIFFTMRNVSDKRCRENQNINFIFNNVFRKSCRLWDNVEKYGGAGHATDNSITRRMRFSCCITKLQTHAQNRSM
jgi:hypothetical protein